MKLILLGPPGAGKGTHAKILGQKFRLSHLATGDIFRRQIREKTEVGIKAQAIIDRGGLVPDDLVNEMMFGEIRAAGVTKGFILDGYPRTIGQAEALDLFLKEEQARVDVVLDFSTSHQVIVDRLSGRRVCPQCSRNYHVRNIPPKQEGRCDECGAALVQRKDDAPETIRHRLDMYERETRPLIDYYEARGILREVPGDYDVPELQETLRELFDSLSLRS